MFSSRHVAYEKYRSLKASVITLEGLIGAGKTSLGNSLEHYLKSIGIDAKFFAEYRNDLLLDQFISDMKTHAYTFELFMLAKRGEIYREAQRYAATGGVAIIDRSIVGDWAFTYMQYKNGNITDKDWDVYNSMLEDEQFPEPSYTVLLQCSSQKAISRTKKRGIISEQKYQLNYFEDLTEAYNQAFMQINHPLIKITWEHDKKLPMGRLSPEDTENVLDLIVN